MFQVNLIGTGSNLFLKADVVKEINGFDESFPRLQDVEFLVRVFEKCKACVVDEVLIIKTRDGVNNLPQYAKLRTVKKQFFEKYDYQIERFTESDKQRYFANEYERLLNACIGIENKTNLQKAIVELQPYRSLSKAEKLKIFLAKIGKPGNNLYTLMRTAISTWWKFIKSNCIYKELGLHYDRNSKMITIEKEKIL